MYIIKRVSFRNSPLYTVFRLAEIKIFMSALLLLIEISQSVREKNSLSYCKKKNRAYKNVVVSVIRDFYFIPL